MEALLTPTWTTDTDRAPGTLRTRPVVRPAPGIENNGLRRSLIHAVTEAGARSGNKNRISLARGTPGFYGPVN